MTQTLSAPVLGRIARPLSLVAQVEQRLRDAIAAGRFPGDRLPTEVELAEQLGISRETVRRACTGLEQQGLVVKMRRKGTFQRTPDLGEVRAAQSTLVAYMQTDYQDAHGAEEAVTSWMSDLMLRGAVAVASKAGFEVIVRRAPVTQMGAAFRRLYQSARLRGVIFVTYGEEKVLRRVTELGIPAVLLDHDLYLPQFSSVRDDSCTGARQAVAYLAELGHRRIAFANWQRTELNPWRLHGYRQGLRDAGVPRRRAWELAGTITSAGVAASVDEFLRLTPRPTAILCFNNTQARLMINELQRRGLRVPQDVSVMGSGGEDAPGLTCQQADWQEMGGHAMTLLLRQFDPRSAAPAEHVLKPFTLQVGQTTASPPR